jgi:glycosyltransferase involved in cell wall biosynthesis
MPEPTVSALIPVQDGERHLGAALESVLAQTRPVDEVVVVDNASTDRSAEIARGFGEKVRVVSEPDPGVGLARNAAVRAASGEYLAFLDHDDLWEPRKTELQLAAFEADPGLDFVVGHVVQFTEDLEAGVEERVRIPAGPQPGQHLEVVMAPRPTWERIGPWSREVTLAEGLVWFLRASELGMRHAMLPEVIVRRRIHGANRSFGNHDQRSEWTQALKASLDAKRAAGGG